MITEITIAVVSSIMLTVIMMYLFYRSSLYSRGANHLAQGFSNRADCMMFLCEDKERKFLYDAVIKRAILFDPIYSADVFKDFVLDHRDELYEDTYKFVVESVIKHNAKAAISDLKVLCGLLDVPGNIVVDNFVKDILRSARRSIYDKTSPDRDSLTFTVNSLYAIVMVRVGNVEKKEAAAMLAMYALPILDDKQKETVLSYFPHESLAEIKKAMGPKLVTEKEDESDKDSVQAVSQSQAKTG